MIKTIRHKSAQAVIEFTFAMIVIMLLIFGLIKIFQWAGLDMAERRYEHDHLLTNAELSAEQQLAPNFHRPRKMNASFRGFDL